MIQRNGHWLEQKAKVKELLSSEEYKTLMKKPSTECETVFGQTKGNLGFRRFHLRGKEKVGIEWGLLSWGWTWLPYFRVLRQYSSPASLAYADFLSALPPIWSAQVSLQVQQMDLKQKKTSERI